MRLEGLHEPVLHLLYKQQIFELQTQFLHNLDRRGSGLVHASEYLDIATCTMDIATEDIATTPFWRR